MLTDRPGHPHENSALARFITQRLDELRGVKTQREIAAEAGFKRPNIISMFKTGETQLPLERIPAFAKALEADPAHVFRLAMQDYWPELRAVVDGIFGRNMASANEIEIFLTKWRAATRDADPAPNARIVAAVDTLMHSILGPTPTR
jgi:hypothetical protein